jgi:hypothetical protein
MLFLVWITLNVPFDPHGRPVPVGTWLLGSFFRYVVAFGTTTTMVRLRPEEEDRGVVMVLRLTIWDDPPITFVRVMANEAGHDDAAGQAQSCCWERVE